MHQWGGRALRELDLDREASVAELPNISFLLFRRYIHFQRHGIYAILVFTVK